MTRVEYTEFVDVDQFTEALPHSLDYASIENGQLYRIYMKLRKAGEYEFAATHAIIQKQIGARAIALADGGWIPQVDLYYCDQDMQPALRLHAGVSNRQFTMHGEPFRFLGPQLGYSKEGIIVPHDRDPDQFAQQSLKLLNTNGDAAHDAVE